MSNGSEAVNHFGLDAGVERGLDFLRRSQLPWGEFKVFLSIDNGFETDCVPDSTPFPTALIAYSLGFADADAAREMLDKSLRFFLAEMEGPGLWRYWSKRHQSHSTIPPDLDDISCASYVLRRHGGRGPQLLFRDRAQKRRRGGGGARGRAGRGEPRRHRRR